MVDIASCCRTCMKDNVTLIDLFETVKIEENCLQLAEILVLCTPTQVSKEDDLPKKLCEECAKILQVAYSFRNQAEKVQEEFKKLLQNKIKFEPSDISLKIENEHDYFEYDCNIDVDFARTEEADVKNFTCHKCNKTFLKEKRFLKHLQIHESQFQCHLCSKTYRNQTSLAKHIVKHGAHTCVVCNQSFESEHLLLEHVSIHTDNKEVKIENEPQTTVLQCPHCDLTFTKQRSLSLHQRRHRNANVEFICDTCGKVFSMKHLLKRHVLLHSEVKPHKCTQCSKTFARRDQLTHHMHNIHTNKKPYECSYCKKGFIQLCSLKDHIRSHTGETPFLCSECGKGFTNSSNLRQHMMRHTGLKPYACNMCPKTFCTKGQMTAHMTTHSGQHPYKCEECGASFTKQNSLKKHSMIHLGIRPFACDSCDMRFTCKDHLKRHYRIHTGEKPYRCNYCERAYSQSNDLVKHLRVHVGQNTYQCTICGMRFRLLSELKSHYPVHFVDGKMQPPETKEDPKPPSPTKELEPMLIMKPTEIPLLPYNQKDLHNILSLKPPVEKDLPVLSLKPSLPQEFGVTEVRTQDDRNRYTITINSCDKNGLVNGIIINIPPKDS